MSYISKLKPRIKPRLGGKVSDDRSAVASVSSTNAKSPSILALATRKADGPTSGSTACLDQNVPSADRQTCPTPISVAGATSDISTPVANPVTNEEKITCNKILHCPGSDPYADQNSRQPENPSDSTEVNKSTINDSESEIPATKPKEVAIAIREKPKPRINGFKHRKPEAKVTGSIVPTSENSPAATGVTADSTPVVNTISIEEKITCSKISGCPGPDPCSNAKSPSIPASATRKADGPTSSSTACLDQNVPSADRQTYPTPASLAGATAEISTPVVNPATNEELTCNKILHCPGSNPDADQNSRQPWNPTDSIKVNESPINDSENESEILTTKPKPKEVSIAIREKPKPKIIGFKHRKPAIKILSRPNLTLENPVLAPPVSTLDSQTSAESEGTKDVATPCGIEGSLNKNESTLAKNSSEFSRFPKKSDAKEPQNAIDLPSVNETVNNNRSETIEVESVGSQEQCGISNPQDINLSSKIIEANGINDLSLQDNQSKCGVDAPKSTVIDDNQKPDVIKKHPLIKRPPRILRKAPKLDRSRTMSPQMTEKPPPALVAPSEKARLDTNECSEQQIMTSIEDEGSDEQNLENVSHNNIPIIDTTKSRNQTLEIAPLGTVSSNTDKTTSDSSDRTGLTDDCELSNRSAVDKAKSGSSTKSKTGKSEVEDVRTLCAMSAIDYLRRHDHALGDSIIRKLIVGAKNMQNRNLKATMCSSCNPQTLQKCLASLWSLQNDELQMILKKSAERQKAPVSFANFSGKPLFKPSLGRQRAPTLTASTYGKMCFEVKEGLAKKYGPNAPELSKLRMLDLIFYNPSNNPMSKPSTKSHSSETSSKKGSLSSNPSTSTSGLNKTDSSDISRKGSDQSDSDVDDPDDEGDRSSTTSSSTPANNNEQNNNAVPVPQVKIGDEGQIILAPESLVLKQPESDVLNKPVVHEGDFSGVVRRKNKQNRTSWGFEETVKFYKSLHGMGTDFTSMLTLFPNRSRSNLKSKFKREERKNSALIDKVLGAQGHKLNMADVEKDLAADKTLRRLVIQSRKYSPDNATSSVPKSGRRKKMDQLIDDDEPDDLWRAARIVELDPVLASSIPNNLRSRSVAPQKGMKNETAKKRPPEEEREENAVSVECESEPSEKTSDKLDELKSGETFKKPVGRPPSQRKRMLERKSPSIIKKAKKSRVAAPSPPPRIHTICLDDFEDPDGNDTDDSESLPETDHLGTDSASGRDDCFVIETNYEHESFNCIKTVKFSVDNPDLPMDVNATIEHKGSLDEQLAEFNSEVNESGDIIQVVSININQLPSYLEQTGAVVIQAAERE